MSTDDGELTFIRCPGCRSLVPAVATRCRMCGQVLSGNKETKSTTSADASGDVAKPRVRQKTLSVKEEEVAQVKTTAQSSRSEESVQTKPETSTVSKFLQANQQMTRRQELAAEDLEDTKPVAPYRPITKQAEAPKEAFKLGQRHVVAGFGTQNRPTEPEETRELIEEDSEEDDSYDDEGFLDGDDFGGDESEGEESSELMSILEERPKKSRRRRRRKKNKPQEPQIETPVPAKQTFPQAEVRRELPAGKDANFGRHEQGGDIKSKVAPQVELTKADMVENKEDKRQVNMQSQSFHGEAQRTKADGRLIGWLLNFRNDQRGAAIEIREGRFFIGGAKVRDTDLVLPDPSISIPHCLVKAEPKDGLTVQDLMSEKGTFIRRLGSSSYELITAPTLVEHGDWLKFGDYEVLACIVPPDGRKQKS